ncbi:DUF6705 family protein [uncultured Flavobacterium sp.]|uniref:DUF6705 family protein n=1 Tax=uncultured Flavobacterium sp. TaxID=165435 RepID=UPI0025929E1E|nr:DUF6705 family protein [uncultured Flavobacterium sp.]
MIKNTLKILSLLLFTINCNCQTLPLNSPEEPDNGGYLKDIDNVLPFWVGTWKGTVDNKEYTFQFTTFLHNTVNFPNGDYYYKDKLMGKFKVVDLTTNMVLYDDLSVSNFEDYKIRLSGYGNNIGYVFRFVDDNAHCNNKTEFTMLKNSANPNQIKYLNFEYQRLLSPEDCIYPQQGDIPMFLPKVDLILTRQ